MAEYTFVSYTHENTGFALKLARHLRRQGISVWLDQWSTPADGEEWDRAIAKALRGCSHCLVILSPPAIDSWLVREQVWQVRENGGTVISVLHQPCEIPEPLQDTPCVDFTGRDYRVALGQLLKYYFPNQEIRVGYWAEIKPRLEKARGDLALYWRYTLLPLLWPGWLGPIILLSLIAIGIFFWTRDSVEPALAPSTETLAVVQPTSTPIPLPTPIVTNVRALDGKVMVFVPAGEFLMGSAESDSVANDDEMPQHPVYLDEYWIDKTEITTGQYQQCIDAGICSEPRSKGVQYQQCVDAGICPPLETEDGVSLEDLLPVVGVNWDQANAYCQWVGGRLPTEAEWEKAARGTDGRIYPWGNSFDGTRLNFCDRNCVADVRDLTYDDGYRYVAPTGHFPAGASPYGALDMSGNVWEWTADWYNADAYSTSAYENPTGPESGQQRVIRGGSWSYRAPSLRVARRHRDTPTTSHDNSGFRCVVSEAEETQLQPEAPTSRRFWSLSNQAY